MQARSLAPETRPRTSPSTSREGVSLIVPLGESRLPDGWPESCLAGAEVGEIRIAASAEVPDAVLDRLRRRGMAVTRSDAPRGQRVREQAQAGRGSILVFLHADTRLPASWPTLVDTALSGRRPWGAFRLGFESRRLGLVAFGANLRSRFFGLPFGDQAPFVTRAAYAAVGGHPPWNLLDDLELSLRLRRLAPPLLLPARVRTSPRRYLDRGRLRTVWTNLRILWRFSGGANPIHLESLYHRRP